MSDNYLDLIEQKKKIMKKLDDLNKRQFGATSAAAMDFIIQERKELRARLSVINEKLSPSKPDKFDNRLK